MKKRVVSTLSVMFFSCNLVAFNAFACGGDVDMTVPHIHDENGLLIAIEKANSSPSNQHALKQIDIYQIFSGELASNKDAHQHGKTH
ncbi:hypothetical protein FR932_09315 [Moritella marina ATCC 15381]|uniref:Uncharacterized protein n=1 Tax=Moritella marina ATCC 15381 TaxID=1202962 RepID=A0A5J6WKS5_MORMI|nr:hypothetical protein [Moritella marina]QFI38034.1 hypothetical protein FR932_09315 [Moritella marina ATCC 15381]